MTEMLVCERQANLLLNVIFKFYDYLMFVWNAIWILLNNSFDNNSQKYYSSLLSHENIFIFHHNTPAAEPGSMLTKIRKYEIGFHSTNLRDKVLTKTAECVHISDDLDISDFSAQKII